ncbi:hypothetical protein E4U30_008398 [Claviceps sp. LM220 group G6]|nr:hypothetical protein E4U30_008398 [Claviceps sp. LM220 group G6]
MAFTQRLEDMAESHSEKAVKDNWIACLKGQALLWHSRHLRQAERQRLREASLETICKRLVEHFRESQSEVLDRIKKAKFTLQKYHNGESLTIFVNNLLQDARVYFNEEIAQIRTVHQAFDSQIQLVIPPPTEGMTVEQFLVQLRDRESTIRALARDKFKTAMNQQFRDSRNVTNDRYNRRQQDDNYRNFPRPHGQLGQYQGARSDSRDHQNGYQNGFQNGYQRPQGQNDARNWPRPDANRAVVPFGDMSTRDTGRQPAARCEYNADARGRDQDNGEDHRDQYDQYENQDIVDQAQRAQEEFQVPYPEVEWDMEYTEGWRHLPADENAGEKVQCVDIERPAHIQCRMCGAHCSSRNSLSRHLEDQHGIDKQTSEGADKTVEETDETAQDKLSTTEKHVLAPDLIESCNVANHTAGGSKRSNFELAAEPLTPNFGLAAEPSKPDMVGNPIVRSNVQANLVCSPRGMRKSAQRDLHVQGRRQVQYHRSGVRRVLPGREKWWQLLGHEATGFTPGMHFGSNDSSDGEIGLQRNGNTR